MFRRLFGIGLLLFAGACFTPLHANPYASVSGATLKDQTPYRIQDGQLTPLTANLTLPCDVEVTTNGTFKVGENGKERQLQEGQVIRNDGWLINPNGTVEPVVDHIAVKNGKVLVVRDGSATTLTEPMTCTNSLQLTPDGYCVYPDGTRRRLQDGQLFQLDGTVIPAMDAVSLIHGQVVVQKDGTLIRLQSVQIMGMDDGSRISGDGSIQKRNGSSIKLQEGQTVLLNGIRTGH